MESKDILKKFIEDKSNIKIKTITDVCMKDYDDDIGSIGKHLIVYVETDWGEFKKCYVNREHLDCYMTNINSVIWE